MSILDSRELGDYPVSVGTAMAIQGLVSIPMTERADWLVNLRTLFRNMVEAVPSENRVLPRVDDAVHAMLAEIERLHSIVAEALPKITLRIYSPSYASIIRTYPHASHKFAKTPKQKEYAELERRAMALIVPKLANGVEKVDCRLPHITQQAFIMTHYPADLLAKNGFGELILVESYTGALKRRAQWSCKLTGSDRPEVANLPFNRLTLQVFGDNATQFYSSPPKMKQLLLETADSGKWHTLTPDERVSFSIGQLRDPFARRYFGDMLRG